MTENELFGNSEQLNDTISRAAVVDEIEGVDWYHINRNGEMVHGANDADHQAWYKADDIYAAIERVPSAQFVAKDINVSVKQPGWIPCSEQLPKDYESVNVTVRIPEGRYVKESAFLNGVWIGVSAPAEVVAWCPLPEPWKGDTP